MADYPCDWHNDRYAGEATRLFLNLYRNNDRATFRASICGECLAEVVKEWLEHALHKDPRGFWVIPDGTQELEDLWEARSGPAGRSFATGLR